MSDRYDRAVVGALGATIVTCLAMAAVIDPAPLPPADAARWISLAKHSTEGQHLLHQTFQIDAVDAGGIPLTAGKDAVSVPLGRRLAVSGWAIDPELRGTARRLLYRVDGGAWRDARYHLAREDVARVLDLPAARDSGFAFQVPTAGLAPGEHELVVATTNESGARRIGAHVRFVLTAP